MDEGEPLDKAAARELQEETSVNPADVQLFQVGVNLPAVEAWGGVAVCCWAKPPANGNKSKSWAHMQAVFCTSAVHGQLILSSPHLAAAALHRRE